MAAVVRRSPELEALAREAEGARERGDDAWFDAHTAAGDIVMLGSAPDEATRGEAQPRLEELEGQLAEAGLTLVAGDVEAYECGDAGWVIQDVRMVLADGSYVPARSITACVRDDGVWKQGTSSLSVLVPDELLVPGSPLARPASM